MITLFLLMPAVGLFMAVNVIVGCWLAIRLGYGPPNWQTALNLVVRVTVFQDKLNEARDWIGSKAPWADKLLTRIQVPKPIIIIDVTADDEAEENNFEDQIEKLSAIPIEELLAEADVVPAGPSSDPVFYDESLAAAITKNSTDTWFVNDKNPETSLLKLNAVLMKSGRFAAGIENKLRSSMGIISEDSLKQIIDSFKDDCQQYLDTQADTAEKIRKRINEFGEYKSSVLEAEGADTAHVSIIHTILKDLDTLPERPPNEGAAWLLQQLTGLRKARHQLRDMRERAFTLVAAKEERLTSIPKQLYVDELFGIRSRIGLTATLYDWWKSGRQKGRFLTFALTDFVRFGELNDSYGIITCDKIIKHFAAVLKERFEPGDLFGIYYGNAFLTVTINAGLQKTITALERIRQSQMKTTYIEAGNTIPMQVLLTGAVVESTGEQSVEEVLTSLDQTMAAAKSAGRNHTFCWNAGAAQAEKTESPNFGEPEQQVVLE